jgi:hypothetical protein
MKSAADSQIASEPVQALNPFFQDRRNPDIFGKNSPTRSDKRLDSKLMKPFADIMGRKTL